MRLTWKKHQSRDFLGGRIEYHLRLKGAKLATVSYTHDGRWYWVGSAPKNSPMNSLWRKETDPYPASWDNVEDAKADCKRYIQEQLLEAP